ncbi:unnamed protein product [Euphydryas editha]|uniref:Uncharacterized protein n=1 Tax=Euphydryas editha TaxID=104508 RepID=A0AAU9UPF6_EUPED|nr:unnamed protein product [Euphydryas editha]
MEFTLNLTEFQGVLIAADCAHCLSKITLKGGNEDKIKFIVDSIKEFLHKEKHLVENKIPEDSVTVMRKLAFYVVMNSDLDILGELVDLDEIDNVIWTIPTIPKYLMCELLWQLHMDKYLYEILMFSCPKLALEVANAVFENFKYFNPTDSLEKLTPLTTSCYRLMTRFIFFNEEINVLSHAFRNFQNCLRYYMEPPNATKLESLGKKSRYIFLGKQFHSLLCVIRNCFENYVSNQKFRPTDFQQIYELTYNKSTVINSQTSVFIPDSNNKNLLEYINNANVDLLDTCKNLAMEVNVAVFCAWSEFEFEDKKTIQQVIGELSYRIINLLHKIVNLANHPMINIFKQIAYKPLDFVEVINIINTEDIIENLSNGNEREKWIKALLYRDKLCEDAALLEQIDTNLEFLDDDERCRLFKKMHCHLSYATDNIESKLSFAIKVFQHCSSSSKHEIVEEQFSNCRFNNTLQTPEFDNMVTEFFNKLINNPDMDMSKVLTLFIQNPRKVFTKIFTLACDNMDQTDIMLQVMKPLEKYSNHYYEIDIEPCIILVLKETIANILENELKQTHFLRFLIYLKKSKMICGSKLFLYVIMPNLHNALLNKDMLNIYIHCKLLVLLYSFQELEVYRVPTLAMLAQVLDIVRWKIDTYLSISPMTLELVLKLQTNIFWTQESVIPEKESRWLKSKLRNIKPLNLYYYRMLWNPPGNTFAEVISGIRIHKDMDKENLTLWLSKVICSTIVQEWFLIWDSLKEFGNRKTLDIFHDALLLLFVAEKSNHSETSKACLIFCIKNFVATIRYKFFKQPISDNQIATVFNKFAIIENLVEESDLEGFSIAFIPLLSYIAETKPDFPVETAQIIKSKFKYKEFSDIIYNIFINREGIRVHFH